MLQTIIINIMNIQEALVYSIRIILFPAGKERKPQRRIFELPVPL